MKKPIAAPEFAHYPREWGFSPAIDTGGFVFFSGVTGVTPEGVVSEDLETQIRVAFENLRRNLEAAGLDFDDVVDLTSYHVGPQRQAAVFMKIKETYVRPPYPSWTAIGVMELLTPGVIVEIKAIARRP